MTVHTGKGHNRPGQRYWGHGNYVWNNTGDRATLRTNSFKLIDSRVQPARINPLNWANN